MGRRLKSVTPTVMPETLTVSVQAESIAYHMVFMARVGH